MLDDNWDLIDGEAAHAIEVLNYANQVNVIEGLFRWLMHHAPPEEGKVGCNTSPNDRACCELHRTGTLFLLAAPGEYRKEPVHVVKGGIVVHDPPRWEEVNDHMKQFFAELKMLWPGSSPIEVAAFTLWRLNWIHPFKNGNGRSARAFTYACLCLKYGMMLPGTPTVIDLVMQTRERYEAALRAADASLKQAGSADLELMKEYLHDLLVEQLSSVPPATL